MLSGLEMAINRKDIFVFGIFFVLVIIFFNQFLSGADILAYRDLSRYFYPLRFLMAEQVKAGLLPLWNPYIFCGFPLLATLQIGFFYPLTAIYYILPFGLAFNYYIILHYFLAASFMYIMLRYFRLGRWTGLYGGIMWTFSGYLLSVMSMNTTLSSVVWLPLVLMSWDKLMRQKNYFNVVLLAILLALQFLGGEPTIVLVSSLFLVAYALVFSADIKTFLQNILFLALAALITLGLVAVQLIPFIELAAQSDRVVKTAEVYQLPAPDFRAGLRRTEAIIYGPRPFKAMSKPDRIRACFQHCVLHSF